MTKKIFLLAVLIFVSSTVTGCGNGYTHLEPNAAAEMMKNDKNILVVDTRTPEEYEKKHIPGAILIPIADFKNGNAELMLPDKNQTLLLYCWTGRRAEDAAELLVKRGYTKVYEFGGLVDWHGETEGTEQ